VEENILETLTFYRLPRDYHKHLKRTNMLECMNEEIKRRTRVVRIQDLPQCQWHQAAAPESRGDDGRGH
jgi:transposase-like protein